MPDPTTPSVTEALDRVIDDQVLAVLASVDDLAHDLAGSVHDARVAVRKLRSTLVVFRPMLAAEASELLVAELRWFAGELSGARDSQVIRSRITAAIHEHGADGSSAEELLTAFDSSTGYEWTRAREALTSARLSALVVLLEQARLRSITAAGGPGEPLVDRLGAVLNRLLRKADQTLAAQADDEGIHLLRKRVKRVRFAWSAVKDSASEAIEPGSGSGRLGRTLEALQDHLGAYQDAVVTASVLERLAVQVPAVAGLAGELASAQREAAAGLRAGLPHGVEQLRTAAERMRRRASGVRRPRMMRV